MNLHQTAFSCLLNPKILGLFAFLAFSYKGWFIEISRSPKKHLWCCWVCYNKMKSIGGTFQTPYSKDILLQQKKNLQLVFHISQLYYIRVCVFGKMFSRNPFIFVNSSNFIVEFFKIIIKMFYCSLSWC